MSRARKAEKAKPTGRYVRWENRGSALARVEFDPETVVVDWVPLRIVSLPEEHSEKAAALGLKRLGYASP